MEYMTPQFHQGHDQDPQDPDPEYGGDPVPADGCRAGSARATTLRCLATAAARLPRLGLKYVHNDTCYPALLVIGQFIDALNSGKYDLDHTALLITQTGGGCRASNYIKLLRKALVKSGYGNIPVASLNFSGLEKGSGLPITLPLLRKVIACIFYGDMLCALRSQVKPYEDHPRRRRRRDRALDSDNPGLDAHKQELQRPRYEEAVPGHRG